MTEFETLVNFRDLGGYSAADGRRVKCFQVYRSGELVNLSDWDKVCLAGKYRLGTIIDFRSGDEVSAAPDDSFAGVAHYHIDVVKNTGEKMASKEGLMQQLTLQKAHDKMTAFYRMLAKDGYACSGYAHFLRLCMQQTHGALLFHCFAGKDRTGVAAAILLKILGVSDQDIMDEYLKTNFCRAAANQKLLEEAKKSGGSDDYLKVLGCMMSVDARYLQAFFDTVNDVYGSFFRYLESALRITPEHIAALKDKYLEDY